MAKKKRGKPIQNARAQKAEPKKTPKPKLRQPALPGHEQVRNGRLDRFCEDIFDAREKVNDGKQEESGAIQGAMREMQTRGVNTYTAHGVRLMLAKGVDKLSVKIVDKDGAEDGGGRREAESPTDGTGDRHERRDGDEDMGFVDDMSK